MYQIKNGKNNISLNSLALAHFEKLNFTTNKKQLLKYSPSNLLSERIKGFRPRLEKNKKDFFLVWEKNNYAFIRKIILTNPSDFPALIEEINLQLRSKKLTIDEIKDDLEDIFRYDNWRGTLKCKWLFEQINVYVCPYCNTEEVYKTDDKMYVEFDHFYPQGEYPYLALSFNNLIPSCHHCNSTSKGFKPFCITSHLHPYLDNYNEIAHFDINPKLIKYSDSFDIIINNIRPVDNVRFIKYNKDFELNTRYNRPYNKEKIRNLKKKRDEYSDTQIEEIVKSDLLPNITNRDECIRAFFDVIDENEIINKEYGKFQRDFLINFGLVP